MKNALGTAIAIAAKAHADQVDKGGAAYILHPLRIMSKFHDETHRIVAVLHDVVEDSEVTLEDLRRAGFSELVVSAVDYLTRRDGESYSAFIDRCGNHPIARAVKLADLGDNADLSRIPEVTDADIARLHKYQRAWRTLKGPLIAEPQ